jgi:hypothetical protein
VKALLVVVAATLAASPALAQDAGNGSLVEIQKLQRTFGARDDLKAALLRDPNFRYWYEHDPSAQAMVNYAIENGQSLGDILKLQGIERLSHGESSIGAAIEATGKPYDKTYAPIVDAETLAAAQRQQVEQAYQDARARALGDAAGRGLKRYAPKRGEEGHGE